MPLVRLCGRHAALLSVLADHAPCCGKEGLRCDFGVEKAGRRHVPIDVVQKVEQRGRWSRLRHWLGQICLFPGVRRAREPELAWLGKR